MPIPMYFALFNRIAKSLSCGMSGMGKRAFIKEQFKQEGK
jgi:hypothetical protein